MTPAESEKNAWCQKQSANCLKEVPWSTTTCWTFAWVASESLSGNRETCHKQTVSNPCIKQTPRWSRQLGSVEKLLHCRKRWMQVMMIHHSFFHQTNGACLANRGEATTYLQVVNPIKEYHLHALQWLEFLQTKSCQLSVPFYSTLGKILHISCMNRYCRFNKD